MIRLVQVTEFFMLFVLLFVYIPGQAVVELTCSSFRVRSTLMV